MMKVFIPSDREFKYSECKKMFDNHTKIMNEKASFDEVINKTLFYSFYDDNQLTLCVYFFTLDEKLWVNGFGIRKKFLFNKKCFESALSWFNCDIWAETVQKPAIYSLLVCGFKRDKGNLFCYRRKN